MFGGSVVAQAVVSEGAKGSTVAFVDGSVTARYGPGEYEFKFYGGSSPLSRMSARVNDYDDHAEQGVALPEPIGSHGWLVVHDEPQQPVVNLDVDASHNFVHVAMIIVLANLIADVVLRYV
jgi:hypothetical protein